MKIEVQVFGFIKDLLKRSKIELVNIEDSNKLKNYFCTHYPELKTVELKIVVNKTICKNNILFNIDDEICLLPPYSGG